MLIATAAIASAFNLVCSGTYTSDSLALGHREEPYSFVYRFDLAANKWCDGECKAVHDIIRVQPTRIILADEDIDGLRESRSRHEIIDRETGEHSIFVKIKSRLTGMLLMKWIGRCEKTPFSGFPTFETKF